MRKFKSFLGIVAGVIALGASAPIVVAQAPVPASSPFDAEDPEIARIRALDWQHADFNSLDEPTKCAALLALNRVLFDIGAKADARLELLVDYLDKENLGEDYAGAKESIPEKAPPSFDDMLKHAAAYVATPQGAARVGSKFKDTPPEMVQHYLVLYEKSSRRGYEDAADSRSQVRLIGLFLQDRGKLDDFKNWAIAERDRRQAEFQKQQAEEKAKAAQAQQELADKVRAQNEQRELERQEQLASQQLAAAMQYPANANTFGDNVANNSQDWLWYNWAGNYYYSNAYRGQVRDKVQGAYDRWGGNRAGQRAGGGARGGGRR
jgi:hypothetical protein